MVNPMQNDIFRSIYDMLNSFSCKYVYFFTKKIEKSVYSLSNNDEEMLNFFRKIIQ